MKFENILRLTVYICFFNLMVSGSNLGEISENSEEGASKIDEDDKMQFNYSILIAFLSVGVGFLFMGLLAAFFLIFGK